MTPETIRYHERVPAPRMVRAGAALIVALLFWWGLVQSMSSTAGRGPAILPSLVFILCFFLLGYGIMSRFYGVRIRISRPWMMNGARRPVLIIQGVFKGDRLDIPCRDMVQVHPEPYAVPLWRAVLGPFGREKYAGGHMVTLPGYRGRGLVVTYTSVSAFSSRPQQRTVLFPTRRPQALLEALGQMSPRAGESVPSDYGKTRAG
ncbi:MAG: hypothetical protein KKB20_00835 [Proteobacteria bacterium]|nr:hypothetical protein [Pseudomonadota bacterium]